MHISLYTGTCREDSGKEERHNLTATDISGKAIEVAKKNAENILSDNSGAIDFIQCDILPDEDSTWFSDNKGKVDLIVSNPPYISQSGFEDLPREIKDYEPSQALLAGDTGLEFYEKILSRIKVVLAPGACVIFETDPLTGNRLVSMVEENMKLKSVLLEKDYNKKERILTINL